MWMAPVSAILPASLASAVIWNVMDMDHAMLMEIVIVTIMKHTKASVVMSPAVLDGRRDVLGMELVTWQQAHVSVTSTGQE